jgi:nucleotide-binding universal stress UspA family protein
MLTKILVPYDTSKPADSAVEYATDLAASNVESIEIILLHIVPRIPATPLFLDRPMKTSDRGTMMLSEYVQQVYAEMQERAAEMLEEKRKEIESKVSGNKVKVKTISRIADAVADKIIDLAEEEDVDLIVIGNVGLGGVAKLKALGSVSRAVSERATRPVLIIH